MVEVACYLLLAVLALGAAYRLGYWHGWVRGFDSWAVLRRHRRGPDRSEPGDESDVYEGGRS